MAEPTVLDILNAEWDFKWEEYGGYDCMTSAYAVYAKTAQFPEEPLFDIDTHEDGNRGESGPGATRARIVAAHLVAAHNAIVKLAGQARMKVGEEEISRIASTYGMTPSQLKDRLDK